MNILCLSFFTSKDVSKDKKDKRLTTDENPRVVKLKNFKTGGYMVLVLGVGFGAYLFRSPKKVLQDQKILQQRLKHVLSWFCFFMAVYMILILLERYVENRDAEFGK